MCTPCPECGSVRRYLIRPLANGDAGERDTGPASAPGDPRLDRDDALVCCPDCGLTHPQRRTDAEA